MTDLYNVYIHISYGEDIFFYGWGKRWNILFIFIYYSKSLNHRLLTSSNQVIGHVQHLSPSLNIRPSLFSEKTCSISLVNPCRQQCFGSIPGPNQRKHHQKCQTETEYPNCFYPLTNTSRHDPSNSILIATSHSKIFASPRGIPLRKKIHASSNGFVNSCHCFNSSGGYLMGKALTIFELHDWKRKH